jgi:hypothetical protein
MCMSCGCGRPDDQMGDDRNITANDLRAAADAAGITMEQAADNIHTAAREMRTRGEGT